MKKTYKLEDLDCANCAAKMEEAISKIDGVESVKLNFLTQKLKIEAEESELDRILDTAQEEISKIEKDAKIVR